MKYEDFATAKFYVEQINKKQNFLESLDNFDLRVVITGNNSGHQTLTTIGVGSQEHEFGMVAKDFIEIVKENTRKSIDSLHDKLNAI
jgi:hypothetical protein